MGIIWRGYEAFDKWTRGENEIAHLPKVERRRIAWKVTPRVLRHPLIILFMVYLLALLIAILFAPPTILYSPPTLRHLETVLLVVTPIAFVAMLIAQHHIRRHAIQRLIDAGEIHLDYCHGCHYDLRGTPGLHCPECGRARDDDV